MGTIEYRLEVDRTLWEDWKDTVPRSERLNDRIVALLERDLEGDSNG